MKKQILGFALVATSVLALGINANAATEATSEVGVGFQEDSNTTNPTEPGEAMGSLSLRGVPTAFQFGNKHAITNGTMTFDVVNGSATDARQLDVYDDRPDDAAASGWVLKGQLSDLVEVGADATSASKLVGSLKFNMASLRKYNAPVNAEGNALDFPKNPYEDGGVQATPENVPGLAEMNTGKPEPVELQMGGSAVDMFGVSSEGDPYQGGLITELYNIKLVVNNTAKEIEANTNYAGNVMWTLSDTYTGSTPTP